MTVYTNVFGGSTIYPSDVSYFSATLSADIVLSWPLENTSNTNIAASIIEIDAPVGGYSVFLPSAALASTGQTILFNNVGAAAFTVKDATGNTICAPTSGQLWQVYVTENTTAAGQWQAFQYGTGVSVANAASLAGYGLKAISSTLNQVMPVTNFNANYTASTNDLSSVLVWSGGAGVLNLPTPASVGTDWFISVINQGSGTLVVTPVGTIDGGATKNLSPQESCTIICDGSAYYSLGFGQNVTFAFDYTVIDVSGTGNYTLSPAEQNRISYKFVGTLTGDRYIIVPATVQQYWVDNSTTGAFQLIVTTASGTGYSVNQGSRAILYCDGTDVVNAATGGISTPISIGNGGTGATTASGARINLGGGSAGIAVFTSTTQADGRAALGSTLIGDALFTSQASVGILYNLVGGSGYGTGNYTNVPLANGSGIGALANITVTAGSVTNIKIVDGGLGYLPGDILTALNTYLGGTGSGFSVTVLAVTATAARATLDVYSRSETDDVAIAFAIGLS